MTTHAVSTKTRPADKIKYPWEHPIRAGVELVPPARRVAYRERLLAARRQVTGSAVAYLDALLNDLARLDASAAS